MQLSLSTIVFAVATLPFAFAAQYELNFHTAEECATPANTNYKVLTAVGSSVPGTSECLVLTDATSAILSGASNCGFTVFLDTQCSDFWGEPVTPSVCNTWTGLSSGLNSIQVTCS
ncbi:hypothetical protein D9757_010351 [Collybiopsis confluens]|uniref:Uncharacterized protein n=1 Tax=Collybiopsis confluens TaxID=2823264 RepID=A0A8H5GML7_9AGAR|nr:hypothetical protein D9757_010351 [Collybiopsis confluens]